MENEKPPFIFYCLRLCSMLTCAWICISLELNLSFIYFNLRLKYRCPKRGQVYADISDYLEKKQRVARSRERKTYFG
jgi:hypothetical protein